MPDLKDSCRRAQSALRELCDSTPAHPDRTFIEIIFDSEGTRVGGAMLDANAEFMGLVADRRDIVNAGGNYSAVVAARAVLDALSSEDVARMPMATLENDVRDVLDRSDTPSRPAKAPQVARIAQQIAEGNILLGIGKSIAGTERSESDANFGTPAEQRIHHITSIRNESVSAEQLEDLGEKVAEELTKSSNVPNLRGPEFVSIRVIPHSVAAKHAPDVADGVESLPGVRSNSRN